MNTESTVTELHTFEAGLPITRFGSGTPGVDEATFKVRSSRGDWVLAIKGEHGQIPLVSSIIALAGDETAVSATVVCYRGHCVYGFPEHKETFRECVCSPVRRFVVSSSRQQVLLASLHSYVIIGATLGIASGDVSPGYIDAVEDGCQGFVITIFDRHDQVKQLTINY